jgi:mRNA interferase MazF
MIHANNAFCDYQPPGLDRYAIFVLICAPVYSQHDGLSTQVRIGPVEGLKKESSIHCDALVSLPRSMLTHYVGSLNSPTVSELDRALAVALGLKDAATGLDLDA